MFTRSMVIQKRVEDLQLGVESYQKKINVTKPETIRSGIKKRDPCTPYQDPQGFNDGTLTRLRTLLLTSLRISEWSTCHREGGVR
ncbi:hypothetical protein Tco_1308731 [Tanacetum coccineum]